MKRNENVDKEIVGDIPPQFETKNRLKALKVIKFFSRSLDYFVLILSIIAILICLYAFFDTHKIFEIASTQSYQMYKPNSKDRLTFKELVDRNKDVIGWIDVYGTQIDYPIVQGKDNTEYLNKTVLGEFSTVGSIFLDSGNEKDFSDFKNILYGHYMEKRKMFGDMELFKDENFFNTHKYGCLYRVNNSTKGITFFSLVDTVGTDFKLLSPTKTYNKEIISYIYEHSIFKRNIEITKEDKIIMLDTCNLTQTNGRYVLVGKLTDKVEKNTFKENDKEDKLSKYFNKFYTFDFLKIILFLWLLVLILYMIYKNFYN